MPIDVNRVLVMLLAGGKGQRLEPLTLHRAKPAVPFGGIYRIIDFTLSNCINSGIRRINVLVQYKSLSLNRHLREGWSFLTSELGEYVDPIPPQQRVGEHWYLGTADAIHQNLYSVEKDNPEFALILSGDHIYKMDYRHLLEFHLERNADMTVAAVEVPKEQSAQFGILEVDDSHRIIGFQEKPAAAKTLPHHPAMCFASMGVYVFRTDFMARILEEDAADPQSSHDFGKDILPKLIDRARVFAFGFIDENKKEAKYWRDVGTIDAYWSSNMDLISVNPVFNLYDQGWPIRTAPQILPPPKFVFAQEWPGGRMGVALDSLISPGSIISGGRVQNSILSPSVRVNSYAHVSDAILFENVNVGRHAKIKRAIVDKDVNIPEGMQIGYNLDEDRKRFTVSEQGIVVIEKGAVL
jgi:glucose-1-phosphate adenylyltransferase